MALLQKWRDVAYSQEADRGQLQKFWTNYFLIEKGIYEKLLTNPDEVVRGTVKELADKYEVEVMTMVGFLDGINDSLKVQNPRSKPIRHLSTRQKPKKPRNTIKRNPKAPKKSVRSTKLYPNADTTI